MTLFRSSTRPESFLGQMTGPLARAGLRAHLAIQHRLNVAVRQLGRAANDMAPRDAGYTTEMVLATASLVLIALAVVGVIGAKVLDGANAIDLTPQGP